MSRSLIALPLALAFTFSPALAAQEKAEAPKAEEAVTKGLKSRIFEVKHRDPRNVVDAVRLLGSGVAGARIELNRELGTITARDFPENLAQIEEAIKRLDIQPPDSVDVDLTIQVLAATQVTGKSGDLPADTKAAVEAMRSTLTYKSYELVTTFTQRVKDGTRGVQGGGVSLLTLDATSGPKRSNMQMEFSINQVSVVAAPPGPSTTRLEGFKFPAMGAGRAEMRTDVSLKDGELVVLGTSVFHDRGLVLVVSAKRAK
jgi:hypothetical protein